LGISGQQHLNQAQFGTAFTVSVDARQGVTTSYLRRR
jgi:hypothetical protein